MTIAGLAACGVWHGVHRLRLDELREAGKLDFSCASMDAASPRGPYAGAHSTSRDKLDRKRHFITDAKVIPLTTRRGGARANG